MNPARRTPPENEAEDSGRGRLVFGCHKLAASVGYCGRRCFD